MSCRYLLHLRGFLRVVWQVFLWLSACQCALAEPRVGVFYFPGWRDDAVGLAYPKPWQPIRAYPDREPMLGWYEEGRQGVMDQQLSWMQTYGVSFVVFDWYWGGQRDYLGHALKSYHSSPNRRQVPYALMWANHDSGPRSAEDFAALCLELVTKHFNRPEYLRVDGKPIIFIQIPENLENRAKAFGSGSKALLDGLQMRAREAGLPEVLIVAGAGGGEGTVTQLAKLWGYGAYFAYNYHAGIGGRTNGQFRLSHSYHELDMSYRQHWEWFSSKGDMPYILPMTAGWDKRPWGGSADPLHDLSSPTQAEFLGHLSAARVQLTNNSGKSLGLGVICCWNEYGEGSIIEPTKALAFQRLESVRKIFKEP